MDNVLGVALKIAMAGLGIILVYNIITHGDAVVAELTAAGNFITTESKVLQGRG